MAYISLPAPTPEMQLSARFSNPDLDYYRTPPHATKALLSVEQFHGQIWEPACGDGAISKVLEKHGHEVRSSDIVYRGYGNGGHDFLKARESCDNVITNPPYCLAEDFVRAAVARSHKKVAFLLRLAFLEGQRRGPLFDETPLARVMVFRKRITMCRDGVNKKGSGHLAFAWFIWDHAHSGAPTIGWI